MEKLTIVNKFEMLLAIEEVQANEMLVEFINGRIAQASKKNSKTSKVNLAKIAENKEFSDVIIGVLAHADNGMTVTEILKASELDISTSKVTSLLTTLAKADEVVREVVKGKALYSLSNN